MKWSVFICVAFCLLRYGEGGALKCIPGSQDRSCSSDLEEKEPQIQISIDDSPEVRAKELQCLPGSEWESNCHSCTCTESGKSRCQKMDACESEILGEPIGCKPHTSFQRGCRPCVCTEFGLVLCSPCTESTLKCIPGSQDRSCSSDLEEKEPQIQISIDDSPEVRAKELQCLPGSEWESNCHSCTCTESGKSRCQKMDACESEILGEPIGCKPHTSFQRGCRPCVCTEFGLVLCSPCTESSLGKEQAESADKKELLVPHYNKDIYVQLNIVDNEIHGYHSIFKRSLCRPNQEFKADCNICKCSPTGGSYKCIQNECMDDSGLEEVEVFGVGPGVDHVERQTVCKPRALFHISCNTCRCNYDGTDYSCTENPCPIPQDVELIRELKIIRSSLSANKSVVCVANRMFIKDCNTCWCNEDGTSYFCTRRVCVEENPDDLRGEEKEEGSEKLRIIKKQCKPNEVFELDCNMCRCNPDGQSYSCTRRACVELPDDFKNLTLSRKTRRASQEDAPKTCQPGQEFRMDCNKCLCDNEGQDFSCTRIDCNTVNNNHQVPDFTHSRSKRARPGAPMAMNQPWPRPGNVRPDKYARHQQQDINANLSRQKREASEKVSGGCKPGELFARDCNMCRCSTDGHVATCTFKQCPKAKDGETDVQATDLDPSFRCNAGEQFKQDCNDCTCSADGKSVFCTLHLCDMDFTPDISI